MNQNSGDRVDAILDTADTVGTVIAVLGCIGVLGGVLTGALTGNWKALVVNGATVVAGLGIAELATRAAKHRALKRMKVE